ncbi:hypothetical protein NQ317_013728 [Molorchus minor]|uniref:Thioredoxin domain-containing protein n=1 Tax=Molorchus minor TaxID=1323400 RepID=A0ABQ9JPX3_9CUCU|nr:hypothetical protein NQ317_013728 [Molorchus minor]
MTLLKISARVANTSPVTKHDHETGDSDAINDRNSNISSSDTDTENNEIPGEVVGFQDGNENEIPTIAARMELAIFLSYNDNPGSVYEKVTQPPAAYPFFSKDSIVTDWYRGEISKAIEQAKSSDIAFVMFYAPWDADSQHARKEFEETAQYMQDFVKFSAVNCWQPNSECRNQYNKVYRWPVLIAYPSHGRGIQYNGPISVPYMIVFLKRLCHPFLRFSNETLWQAGDAYLVAHLSALPGSIDFAVFYTTALKYLERDPVQSVTFFVNPQTVQEPLLHLHLWNETLIYPSLDHEWGPDEILQWVFENLHKVTSWVAPTGSKSTLLSKSLQPGPALILFTPNNPLHLHTDYYNMLQEIGYEYFNCDASLLTNLQILNAKIKKSIVKTMKKSCTLLEDELNHFCSGLRNDQCPTPIIEKKQCERNVEFYQTSRITGENDRRSAVGLLKSLQKENCRQFLMAEKYQSAVFETTASYKKKLNVTGLSCKTNSSLAMIVMDSLLYYHFAERLGIDLLRKSDKSAVVIVNQAMESSHVLQASINSINVRKFIKNFTKSQLTRSLDSYSLVINSTKRNSVLRDKSTKLKEFVFVEELNTKTFLPTVLQSNKAILIYYYSKQCAFCSSISFVLLTVIRKLSSVDNLQFYRIDGDINKLPWEYTMESYPTILFFPIDVKSESRVYPVELPITVPNLINFILTNLKSTTKLQTMWTLCNQTKFKDDKISCLSMVQAKMLTVIEETLSDWRTSNRRQKRVIVHKLIKLKQLHFLIAHHPKRHGLIVNYFRVLNLNSGTVKIIFVRMGSDVL